MRKKKNFKRFKHDLQQAVLQGKNTDDVQYVLETDGYSHPFACYLLSVFGTFTEGQNSEGHRMAGNAEVMDSTADTCKNCAKCGKGFKIGTNEAYNIKIKIRLGGISKFSAFVLTPIWLPQTKAFH